MVASQILTRLDQCFKLIGAKPVKVNERLHEIFIEDFRRELNEMQTPAARKLYVLAKASHLVHLQAAAYRALIAVADAVGHPGVGVLLESCLADKLAFADRARRLIRERIQQRVAAA
jgi:ferritin-like metal-binding protein YciE